MPPTVIGFYRMLIGGLLLAFLFLRRRKLKDVYRVIPQAMLCSLFCSLDLTFYHQGIRYVGPGLSTLLGNLQVFFLTIYGLVLLKERVKWTFFGAVPLAVAGLFMIVGFDWSGQAFTHKLGFFLGLASALSYSTYLLSLRRFLLRCQDLTSFEVMALVTLCTLPFLGVEAIIQGQSLAIPDLRNLLIISAYGVGSQVAGWCLLSKGLPKISVSLTGLLLLLQPAFSYLWEAILFSRKISPLEVIGTGLVLISLYLGNISSINQKTRGD